MIESTPCEHQWEEKTELLKPERSPAEAKRTANPTQIPYAEMTWKICTKCKVKKPKNYKISN